MPIAGWCSGSTYSPLVSLGQAVASPGQVFRLSHSLTHPRYVVCIRMPKTGCVLFMLFLELMKHNVTAHHAVSQMKDPTWGCSSTNKHTSHKQSCKMCFCLMMSAPRTAPSARRLVRWATWLVIAPKTTLISRRNCEVYSVYTALLCSCCIITSDRCHHVVGMIQQKVEVL